MSIVYVYPSNAVTANVTPFDVQFQRNGSTQVVTQDTVTPANSRPLPVIQLNSSGAEINYATETTLLTRASESTLSTASNTLTSILSKQTYAPRARARIDFSLTNVTNAVWTELISTVGATAIKRVQVFMSQGNALELGFGAAASEVAQVYLFPGGNEVFEMDIPAGTRLSVKAVSSTANSGELLVNLLG